MLVISQTCVQVLPLGCLNQMYLNNLENIMNPLDHVYFPHLMNMLLGLQLYQNVCDYWN
jgi:hypothetical protein